MDTLRGPVFADDPSRNLDGHASRAAELRQVADQAMALLQAAVARGGGDFSSLSTIADCVYLKNSDRVVVYSNDAHRRHFTPHSSPIGRTAASYLSATMASRGERLETLILEGCPYIECEHSGPCPDGGVYRIVAHKRSLKDLGFPGLAIMGLLRMTRCDDGGAVAQQIDLSAAAARFRELTPRDQEMCRLTALGVSSRELGERLGMTTRGIELRKQKAFSRLGVGKAVELARLLTRLQDGGFLDLGL